MTRPLKPTTRVCSNCIWASQKSATEVVCMYQAPKTMYAVPWNAVCWLHRTVLEGRHYHTPDSYAPAPWLRKGWVKKVAH